MTYDEFVSTYVSREKKSKIRSTEPKDSPDLAKRREIGTRRKTNIKKRETVRKK